MNMEKYTVAVLGCGSRGCTYAEQIKQHREEFTFTALCDVNPEQIERIKRQINATDIMTFTDVDEFLKEKRADALIIATPDRDHVPQAVKAMKLGYDILLEKPISDSREEIEELLQVQQETGRKAIVCHVLRYAPGFQKCAEILETGKLGRLYAIDASERVRYWHWVQAYVRGIGASIKLGHPAILAKCSHDLDLIQSYAKSECDTVSSVGGRDFFIPENAPSGAAKRCLDCPHQDTCVYSAKKIYIDAWHESGEPAYAYPFSKVSVLYPHTEERIREGLRNGEYGQCVFHSKLDKVDHQMVQMTFKNGVKASLKMVYSAMPGRRISFYCTYGEMLFDERTDTIVVMPFGGGREEIQVGLLKASGDMHAGGDHVLSIDFCDLVSGKKECPTTLKESLECHLMGIAAEESRKEGGKLVKVHRD